MSDLVAVRARVEGRVQGVGFRWSVEREAVRLGASGWVRNLADGSVEAHIQGSADVVAAMVDHLHRGPAYAIVEEVSTAPAEADPSITRFMIQ